jgi:WD40 repeat protein
MIDYSVFEAPACAFSLLNDGQMKLLTSPSCMASWNPVMDLVAIVSEDQRLVLYRLDWQRVWSIISSLKITALCWRPDGKVLVTGHEDGSMAHHSVERGEVILKTNPTTQGKAINQLSWREENKECKDDQSAHLRRRHCSLLPRSSAQVPKPPASIDDLSTMNTVAERVWPLQQSKYNVLVAADKSGVVRLLESGRLELASISVNVMAGCRSLIASISQDLKALVITHLPTDKRSAAQASVLSLEPIHSLKMHDLSILLSDAEDTLKGALLGLSTCLKGVFTCPLKLMILCPSTSSLPLRS